MRALAAIVLLLLASYASAEWVKPGGTYEEFARARYDCLARATYIGQPSPSLVETLGDLAVGIAGAVNKTPLTTQRHFAEAEAARAQRAPVPLVNEDLFKACLESYGWREGRSVGTPASSPPPPSTPASAPSDSTTSPTIQGPANAAERAEIEGFQRYAREFLAKPYFQKPPPCDDSWGWVEKHHHILSLAPWGEAAGLRRGDRLVGFGGISLAQYGSASEAWSAVPAGDAVTVRVDRDGRELSIQVPCRAVVSDGWQAQVGVFRAVVDARWEACVDAVRTLFRVTEQTAATPLLVGVTCMRQRAKATPRIRDEYWRMVHAWATQAIEEAHYRPTGLTDVRSRLLSAADALEKHGHASWSSDIRQQIEVFSKTRPQP